MKSLSNLIMHDQIVMVTSILLVMYIFAVVPKAIDLFKIITKSKNLTKKMFYSVFFLVSVSADLAIMILAIHGLVYFLKP